jgi:hypothetical protein
VIAREECIFNWFLQAAYDSVFDPELKFFIVDASFHLSGYISAQNSRYWSIINLGQTFEVSVSRSEDWCVLCHYCYTNSGMHFLTQLIESSMTVTFFSPL